MLNIFVNRHYGPRSNDEDAMTDFHFRDLEMRPSRSPGVKFFTESESPISTSHKCFIVTTCLSHHQEDIGDFHARDRQMTPKGHSMSN